MRFILSLLSAGLLACSAPPPCTSGASNLKITDAQGATLHQADAVCAGWNADLLSLFVEADLANGEKLYGLTLSSRVNPQTVGSFDCERSELGVNLNVGIESDRRFDYADTSYVAGHDPGSQINGTSCTWEVSSAPPSGTVGGTFVGRLGRVQTVGTIELVDVRFTFSTKGE